MNPVRVTVQRITRFVGKSIDISAKREKISDLRAFGESDLQTQTGRAATMGGGGVSGGRE